MTDINLQNQAPGPAPENVPTGSLRDERILYELIELLFFAYRDFVSDPDEILANYEFGRAHHRVIHFIARNPGIKVASLLNILRITKQSLGRVLRQMIRDDFVFQKAGHTDRRERELYLTEKGEELARELARPQLKRIAGALDAMAPGSENFYREILYNLINPADRDYVRSLTQKNTGAI